MTSITVEHNPDQERLTELGVYAWPIWEKEASEFPWFYDEKETAYILEGEVVVSAADGSESAVIKAGDLCRRFQLPLAHQTRLTQTLSIRLIAGE